MIKVKAKGEWCDLCADEHCYTGGILLVCMTDLRINNQRLKWSSVFVPEAATIALRFD